MGKGSNFERIICKQLSVWWSLGKRDDIFWRTSGSGARATVRKQATFGQYGDVQATDPIGQPLIDLCTIEIKKGYSRQTFFDLIDMLPSETKQTYKKFILQAIESSKRAHTPFWMLITKRDRKQTLVTVELKFMKALTQYSSSGIRKVIPCLKTFIQLDSFRPSIFLFTTTLEQFLLLVKPSDIESLQNEKIRS